MMDSHLDTVDGRTPAPVDIVNIPLFAGFLYIPARWLAGFLNHQQNHLLLSLCYAIWMAEI